MKLHLNEQEIIDGICVFVANEIHTEPDEVDVKEISTREDGDIWADAICFSRHHHLDSEDILEGVFQFLEEFHAFNRQDMHGLLFFNRHDGYSAEITVNE